MSVRTRIDDVYARRLRARLLRGPLPRHVGVIIDAVRDLVLEGAADGKSLVEIAETVSVDALSAHLYTAGSPEPDLIIRTSGEVRLSGFLLWQAKGAQLYFCDVNWPGFRYLDLLRALRVWARKATPTR